MREIENQGKNKFEINNDNQLRRTVSQRINSLGIKPIESLGQNFLVDQESLDLLSDSIILGNNVFEVGPGVGQLTEAFAQKASRVIGVEIDTRFEPALDDVIKRNPNVEVIYGNAIEVGPKVLSKIQGEETQVVSNPPFHITEPLMHMLTKYPIDSATLVVGQKLSNEITAQNEDSMDFGRLTLLAQTFFNIDVLSEVDREKFYPTSKTNSSIIKLIPKEEFEFRSDRRNFLLRRLFQTTRSNPLVKNSVKEGIIDFSEKKQMIGRSKRAFNRYSRRSARMALNNLSFDSNEENNEDYSNKLSSDHSVLTQNQARDIINGMNIPEELQNKTFARLSNMELGILSKALRTNR